MKHLLLVVGLNSTPGTEQETVPISDASVSRLQEVKSSEHADLVIEIGGECSAADGAEITELLLRELSLVSSAKQRFRAPTLKLTCGAETIAIEVRDRTSGATLVRRLPAPDALGPGRNQEIALAASQAFLSSWVDLLVAAEHATARPKPPSDVVVTSNQATPAAWHFFGGASGGVRLFDWSRPLAAATGLGRFGVRGRSGLGFELGLLASHVSTTTHAGKVKITSLGALGEASYLVGTRDLGFRFGAALGPEAYRGRAAPYEVDAAATSLSGVALRSEISSAVLFPIAAVWIGLELRLGLLSSPARFRVADEPDIVVEGLHLASYLTVMWEEL